MTDLAYAALTVIGTLAAFRAVDVIADRARPAVVARWRRARRWWYRRRGACPECGLPVGPGTSWCIHRGRVYHGECMVALARRKRWRVSDVPIPRGGRR